MATVTLDDATLITAAALTQAGDLGIQVTITGVDGGGNVRTQTRMDGARFGTLNVSANKAFTAAAFGAPTKVLGDLVQPGAPLFGFADAAGGRLVPQVGRAVGALAVAAPVIAPPSLTCGVCPPCRRGDDQLCERFRFSGAMVDGGFAELVATSARSLVKVSPTTDPVAIAGLADGGLAA